jgi:hypothetical protein
MQRTTKGRMAIRNGALTRPYATEGIPPSSCCHPSTEDDTHPEEEPGFDAFGLNSYDIDDVASGLNGVDPFAFDSGFDLNNAASGWNGADPFAFDSAFDVQLPASSSWEPTADILSSISEPLIPAAANIEPPGSKNKALPCPHCQRLFVRRVLSTTSPQT